VRLWIRHIALPLALSLAAFQPCHGQGDSNPIVDVQFDAPYSQVDSSFGDEWAPTWGRDDVLYTGSDDGSSFGGIAVSAISFGKLEGRKAGLVGTTIDSMKSFREIPYMGPESAAWQTLGTFRIDKSLYRFARCEEPAEPSGQWCLMTSADNGKSWGRTGAGGNMLLPQDPEYDPPSFVALSKSMAAAVKRGDQEYAYVAAYLGVLGGEDGYVLSRAPLSELQGKNPIVWSVFQFDETWGKAIGRPFVFANHTFYGPDGGNWKTMNSYSVDGVLYMFITRCIYPSGSSDLKHRHIFQNASIIKSADGGKTWARGGEESYGKPMFPGQRFGAPYFVWYGKDGAGTADNADKYVYAVSNNGYFENGDDYVLARVLKSKLPDLAAADWSFYRGGDGLKEGAWTSSLEGAQPILANPGRSSMTGMTYIKALRRYVMVVWHYHRDNFEQGIKDQDLGTVLEFFEARKPWGPWNAVKTFDTGHLGWYAPIIGQRFQIAKDSSSVEVILYATGYYTKPEGGLDFTLYKLNYMPITLSTRPLEQKDPAFVGGR
jgi:hypothetical protein